MIGQYCLVRTYSAGVHAGIVESIQGTQVVLKDATRLWRWVKGKNKSLSLSSVAMHGAGSESRIDGPVPAILLTQAVELIPCSEAGRKFLSEARNN